MGVRGRDAWAGGCQILHVVAEPSEERRPLRPGTSVGAVLEVDKAGVEAIT